MRRSRDSLWVVGLVALVAIGAATFRWRSGVDGERYPHVRASHGASPVDRVAPTKRSGDPRCCAALLGDLARALPPSVHLSSIVARPDLGEVRIVGSATREGRTIDLDPITSTMERLEAFNCFGHVVLHAGHALVTTRPIGSFELSSAYNYDEKASLSSAQAFGSEGMNLETNLFVPGGSGAPHRQAVALPAPSGLCEAGWGQPRVLCCLNQFESWVARLDARSHDCEIVSLYPEGPPTPEHSRAFRVVLDSNLESLTTLLLTIGTRFGGKVTVRELRIWNTGSARSDGRPPGLRVILTTDFPSTYPCPCGRVQATEGRED